MKVATLKNILIILFIIVLPVIVEAQPGGGGSPGDNNVPITGIEWILGAGAFLGARKMYALHKSSSKDTK
jgi:hypothetical protein